MASRLNKNNDIGHPDHSIVLFDGVCNLCNASVNFVLDRDPRDRFRFAPLQSRLGQRLLRQLELSTNTIDTIVLIEHNRVYLRSTAALRIARCLKWPWPLLFTLIVIPKIVRDLIYNWIAKNRIRWFGGRDSCRIPTPELRHRFLDDPENGEDPPPATGHTA